MACASFLKFHPTLPKQGALVVTRHPYSEIPGNKRRQELSKEERARQRHSVEVSTAGAYLHIQPSVLETLTRSAANASANRNRTRKVSDNVIKEEAISNGKFGYQTVSVLPPALKCLVYLWEDLTASCLQTITQHMFANSPVHSKIKKSDKFVGGIKPLESKEKNNTIQKKIKKTRRKQIVPRKCFGSNKILL